MIPREICFIVNPSSAGGRTKFFWQLWQRKLALAFGEIQVRFTKGSGEATRLTRDALREGYRLVVAIGGDGTVNEVVNGFFDEKGELINPEAAFTFLPSGSGGDLRKTLEPPEDINSLIELIRRGKPRPIDIGKIEMSGASGEPLRRYFINIASVGVSADVNRKVNRSSKILGGKATFFLASLSSILSFNNPNLYLQIDGEELGRFRRHLVAVANGKYFGGGMKVAPMADPFDGYFDIVIFGDFSKAEMLFHGLKIYTGAHLGLSKVTSVRGKKIRIDSDTEIWLDVDGEVPGKLPAVIEILPQGINYWSNS